MIAKVVVDVAVDKEFDFLVPDSLLAQVKLGSRVSFSWGETHFARNTRIRT